MTLKAPGTTVLLLNSREVISDLLDGRSANYSDRPQNVMCSELYVLLAIPSTYCSRRGTH